MNCFQSGIHDVGLMTDSDNWYWFQAVSISNRRSFRERIRKYEVNGRECDTVWRDSWCYVLSSRLKARARKKEIIVPEDRPVLGVER